MTVDNSAFDDFVDDCFIADDPLCNKSREKSIELVALPSISQLIAPDSDLDSIVA